MTTEEREQIKAKIIADTESLRIEIKELEAQSQPIAPDNAIGRISRMDAINNRSVQLVGLRSAKSKLNKLERALSRIKDADFGLCGRCKQEIPIARIMFMPYTSRCVRCADK